MSEQEFIEYITRWQHWFAVRGGYGGADVEQWDDAEWIELLVEPRGWVP